VSGRRLKKSGFFVKNPFDVLDNPAAPPKHPRMAKKITATKDRFSKTQIVDQIASDTELTRKQVSAVLECLSDVIEAHVKKNAVGEFVLPGLLKINTVRKPAVKARKGINPFTKEEVMFKAKPATTVVKVRPLKKLKDMAL
jgi:nucleoid DNA-binding protein